MFNNLSSIAGVCYLLLMFAGFYGYVMNIISLVSSLDVFTPLLVIRAVGVFAAPLGAILGYL